MVRAVLEQDGRTVEDYDSSEAFLAAPRARGGGCLLVDAYLPGMGGLDLLKQLRATGDDLPAIMITGSSDVLDGGRGDEVGRIRLRRETGRRARVDRLYRPRAGAVPRCPTSTSPGATTPGRTWPA